MALGACSAAPLAPDDPEVAEVVVDGATGTTPIIQVGATLQLIALDAAGEPVRATWSTSAPDVVTISASGVVTGTGIGPAVVTASTRNRSVGTSVMVHGNSTASVRCADVPHVRRVTVADAAQLMDAVRAAAPGDLIEMADGVYHGRFTATTSGTPEAPITLCGSRRAVLHGPDVAAGSGFLLRASRWVLLGFSITGSETGVGGIGANHNVIRGLEIHGVGRAGIHLRSFSSHNVIDGNHIHHTGRIRPETGEGVYIGTYYQQWPERSGGNPDASDHNAIIGNMFGPHVTAESVDVKEGTTGGSIRHNIFSGEGMGAPEAPWVDSWVAVMGNGYLIEGNRGAGSVRNGFEVWNELDGWARNNVFRGNVADVRAPGYGFQIAQTATGTRIACDNAVTNAGSGFSNVDCG